MPKMSDSVSLRDHFIAMLTALETRMNERTALLVAANEHDKVTLNARLAGMNEFRAQLVEQAARFVDRALLDARVERWDAELDGVGERITKLEATLANWQGRSQQTVWLVGVLFVIMQIALRVLWH